MCNLRKDLNYLIINIHHTHNYLHHKKQYNLELLLNHIAESYYVI